MRIVHLNTQDVAGGAAKVARLLARSQRRSGHEATLLVARRHGPGRFVRRFDPAPHPVLGLFCEEARMEHLHLMGPFVQLSREPLLSADLVHLHNLHYGLFNPLALPALSRAKPCLWTLHDLHPLTGYCNYPVDCQGWLTGCADCRRWRMNAPDPRLDGAGVGPLRRSGAALTHKVRALAYRHSRLTLACPSRWVKGQIERSPLAGFPVHVIPNGIETNVFVPGGRAEARAALGLPQDALIVGGVAAYGVFANPIKGGGLLLEAMRRVWAGRPEVIFLNVGGYEAGPDPRVRNLPFVGDPAALAMAYAALDVFVHASQAETFCLVAVEAMSCGLPVAALDLGPLPEVVRPGRDGLLAAPDSPADLAANIEALLADPEQRRRMGASGRERAVAEFSLDGMCGRYAELAAEVVAGHGSRPLPPPLPVNELPALFRTPELRAVEGAPPDPALDALSPEERGAALIRAFIAELPEADQPAPAALLAKIQDTAQVFVLRGQGRLEEALTLLVRLCADWPEDMTLWRTRGVTLGLMGRRAEAEEAFRVCVEAYPPQLDAWLCLSDMWHAAGDRERALAALAAFAAIDPYPRGYHSRLGRLLCEGGELRAAARAFAQEYRLHGAPEAGAGLAECLRDLGWRVPGRCGQDRKEG